ncbi:MAG: copper amine oxidase N-terminal domain-containing protein, partial [Monoglobus pectinilyticus]
VEMSFLNEAGELEAPPFIENDRTFIPVRKVSEALGAKVLWASDGNKQTIIIILDSIVIRLVVGERNMSIWRNVPDANLEMWRTESINISPEKIDEWNNNGLPITETKILDVTPQVLSDRTYVPIRFISEALGKKVGWDNEESTAYIWTNMEARDENDYDIVIYGGGLQAYASAVAAAKQRTTKLTKILLIAPYPVDELGGISTTGGQNAWDVSKSTNGEFYHQGTFKTLYNRFPMSYNTQEMSNYLKSSLNDYLVDYKTQYDISRVICKEKAAGNTEEPIKIEKITIRGIARDNEAADYTNGYVKWTNAAPITITGKIFIDASEEGRLARSLNTAATTGRYNWPADSLDDDEKGVISDSPTKTVPCDNTPAVRQQAATIIYKLKGVDLSGYQGSTSSETNGVYHSLWGGDKYKIKGSETWKFNDEYSNQGIIIKSLNAGTNNPANDDYYINNFLLFNVDGRANYRDTPEGRRGFSSENSEDENYIQDFYPKNIFKDTMTTDEAWVKARDFFVYH